MNLFSKKCLAAFAGIVMMATSAFAQQPTVLSPLSSTELRIVFEKGIEDLKKKIENSKHLSEEERISLANEIEEDAEHLRDELTSLIAEAAILGDTTYVAGLILSYTGEMNFPTALMPKLSLAPGAEMGLAIFLRNNSYVADAFSGAVAVLGGGAAKLTPGSAQVRAPAKGLRMKVLIAANRSEHPVIKLEDFSGAYVGVGAEMNLFSRSLGAQVYTRPTSCETANPLSCSVYMVAVRTKKDAGQRTPAEAAVKGVYLEFPYTYGAR